MAIQYRDKQFLSQKYDQLGSTRKVGQLLGVSNGTIIYWMKKHGIAREPKLHLANNNSGWGRLGEIYTLGHPYFKNNTRDNGWDDKHPTDIFWRNNRVNIKTSHHRRPTFRIKTSRHKVSFYICLYFNDNVSRLVPVEIWIIPSSIAPHSSISPSLTRSSSKYHRFKLSLKRGKDFSLRREKEYNLRFEQTYSKILDKHYKHR